MRGDVLGMVIGGLVGIPGFWVLRDELIASLTAYEDLLRAAETHPRRSTSPACGLPTAHRLPTGPTKSPSMIWNS